MQEGQTQHQGCMKALLEMVPSSAISDPLGRDSRYTRHCLNDAQERKKREEAKAAEVAERDRQFAAALKARAAREAQRHAEQARAARCATADAAALAAQCEAAPPDAATDPGPPASSNAVQGDCASASWLAAGTAVLTDSENRLAVRQAPRPPWGAGAGGRRGCGGAACKARPLAVMPAAAGGGGPLDSPLDAWLQVQSVNIGPPPRKARQHSGAPPW
jgi:hypothetical protein